MHAYMARYYLGMVVLTVSIPLFALFESGFSKPIVLSSQLPSLGDAYKIKLLGLSNGTLVAVYGDSVENIPNHYVYDLKDGVERPARDVFVRSCKAYSVDCSKPANWSSPLNIANTATLSSINTDWNANGIRSAYHGDSDNPHAFATGSHIVVTWVDKYCPTDAQRTATYLEADSREIPMGCVYAAHSSGDPAKAENWFVDRLTDGSRDPKQDSNKGLSSGVWAITWQEDPLGLQPGEAEGPGEGSSGAKVSKGTDIWYSYSSNISSVSGDIGVWSTPVRITNNLSGHGIHGSYNPIKDINGLPVAPELIDKGNTGASRANMGIVGGSSPPKTVVAYEETKGSEGLDEGKFLRYQVFSYNKPPTDIVGRAGCIISNPSENARRARFVTQTNAGKTSGLRWAIFWREGKYSKGGPADIMLRYGLGDMEKENLYPPIDQNCQATDYSSAIVLDNAPALNVSSNTPTATSLNLQDRSDANDLENARAHRAVLRDDYLNVGYIYTADWAVAEATDLANYNYYIRNFAAASEKWAAPVNISNITDTTINVKEPRLIGPPGNGPGCVDPDAPTDPRDCQNKNVLVAAWGTETNVYAHIGGSVHLDVYVTRSTDQASSYEPIAIIAGGPNAQGESQLRITPAGTEIYAVWTDTDSQGKNSGMFSQATSQVIPTLPPEPEPVPIPDPTPNIADSSVSGDSGLGCSLGSKAEFDPLLPGMLIISIIALQLRRMPGRIFNFKKRHNLNYRNQKKV